MSLTAEPSGYNTRSAARRGPPAPALTPSEDSLSSKASSTTGSQAGTPRADREPDSPKLPPVTPVLYSRVVSPDLAPPVESRLSTSTSVALGESSEPPQLTTDVDFSSQGPLEGPEDAPWTEVTRKTACSHRPQSASSHSSHVSLNANSLSPVSRATHNMSNEELLQIAHRYQSLANETHAAIGPRGSGRLSRQSLHSEMSVPGIDGSGNFSPRVDHLRATETVYSRPAETVYSRPAETKTSGQTKIERLTEKLSKLKQAEEAAKPVTKEPKSKAAQAVKDSAMGQIRKGKTPEKSKERPDKSAKPRLNAGCLGTVIRESTGLETSPPPSDPSQVQIWTMSRKTTWRR
ncbi:hypothetical protein B0H13DRAFT_1864450 [Mycena leptocephala]|nr:hypothetical protein B0H13DRAFT_1864450 [Mycena leptocephala]